MTKYLNADSPRKVVVEAAMQGADHIRAEYLRSCAEADADFYAGLRAAQDYAMEVRGLHPAPSLDGVPEQRRTAHYGQFALISGRNN